MKIKTTFFTIFFLCAFFVALSQNAGINGDGTSPHASAMLDVKSTSKGLLIPRMTQVQRDAITSPATGLLVFQTDNSAGFYFYTGAVWANIGNGGSTGWLLSGNSGINPATQFIGTTDNQPLNFKLNNLYAGQLHPVTGNVFLGLNSGAGNSSGFSNVGIGRGALFTNQVKTNLVALGDSALFNNGTGANATQAVKNTAIGSKALYSNTTGSNNTSIGYNALNANTTGDFNTALGVEALLFNTTGGLNTAIGLNALRLNTTGGLNTATGTNALFNNTTGGNNTATGVDALNDNTTGSQNTAAGTFALFNNTTGNDNTASGYNALAANTTGSFNTASGSGVLSSNITGNDNTTSGYHALALNTSGSQNTASGSQALSNNSIGNFNTATGFRALVSNTTGNNNLAAGWESLFSNTTGNYNVAIGDGALTSNTTGNANIALGVSSGTTASFNNTISIGNDNWQNNASNQAFIGNKQTTWVGAWSSQWQVSSDRRLKTNIVSDVKGLDFIMRLRPVTYFRKLDHNATASNGKMPPDYPEKWDVEKIKETGFIAQEVEEAAKASGYDFSGLSKPKSSTGYYSLSYASFVVPVVKAVQEQQAIIDKQQKQIDELTKRLAVLEKKL